MTADVLVQPVPVETAETAVPETAAVEPGPYAEARAGARASVTGHEFTLAAVLAWARREFQPPEWWVEVAPMWNFARWGAQAPRHGAGRVVARAYAATVGLLLTVLCVWGKWTAARPTRLAVTAGIYLLLSTTSVGAAWPTPWRL